MKKNPTKKDLLRKIDGLEVSLKETAEKERKTSEELAEKTKAFVDVNIDHAKVTGQVKQLLRMYRGANLDPAKTLGVIFEQLIINGRSVPDVIDMLISEQV